MSVYLLQTNTEKEMLPSTKHRSDSASLLDEYAGSTISRLAHKFSNLDVIDVKELNTDDFVEWLKAKGFSLEHCQAFKGNMLIYTHFTFQFYIASTFRLKLVT